MKICVIGSGIAGTLLAWRLAQHDVHVVLVLGPVHHRDATSVSGGVIRAYEPTAAQRDLAVDSLLELAADDRLRAWARYREVSAMWTAADLRTLHDGAAHIGTRLPGWAELLAADELAALGWAGLPESAGAIRERQAGHLDPDALRTAVLDDLAGRDNVDLRAGVEPNGADITVVAAGAWTPRQLAAMGLPRTEFRTKSVQYSVYGTGGWQPPPFVDATTGLYGRPMDGGLLLGLPTEEWDVDPDRTVADPTLGARAARFAIARFPQLGLGPVLRRVSVADCYAEPALLALRPAGVNTYTFTGGSGGAAKSALSASQRAASALLRTPSLIGQLS